MINMTTPTLTEILESEHRTIQRVVDARERFGRLAGELAQ
jgi:hypothetical protein